jgi:hypothetical protein
MTRETAEKRADEAGVALPNDWQPGDPVVDAEGMVEFTPVRSMDVRLGKRLFSLTKDEKTEAGWGVYVVYREAAVAQGGNV